MSILDIKNIHLHFHCCVTLKYADNIQYAIAAVVVLPINLPISATIADTVYPVEFFILDCFKRL